jgi:hypothetical protein
MARKKVDSTPAPALPPAPKAGDVYCCLKCGMGLEVTDNCTCPDGSQVCLKCCGVEMKCETYP